MNVPQRLKPKFLSPYRRPKGLLHPVDAKVLFGAIRPQGLLHPVVRYSRAKNGLALILALLAILRVAPAQQSKQPPDFEKKREAIRSFESGVVPLFVLGDLNEDGAVDQEDLKLLRAFVAQKSAAGISCMAAADLNESHSIDAKDIEVLEQILKPGKVAAPALSSRSRLGCDFRNFFIAARPQTRAGGAVPIHFLDPRFTTQNSSVMLSSGPATIAKSGNEYVVQVARDAPSGSIVTVVITLAGNRKYFYSFSIAPGP
jgi:dockerin type I repeat protein